MIRAEGVSKAFRIGESRGYDPTLRDAIARRTAATADVALRAVGRSAGERPRRRRTVWALRDVSFEIRSGDIVGIIGRNGAGKSTLLKILSRISEPTSGRVGLNGRVGSLLEVGTGFHPELTGRENVFLHGSILGMRRAELRRRFDEIVDFAEIGEFLDTPVKRYSSGMQVRLAFAVAAHLEPEILLVDEVLAVGDVAFQKKCLGRMGEVAGEGRTVLFVSHNMAVVQALCRRGLVLDTGGVRLDGSIDEAIAVYLADLERAMSADLVERTDRRGWQEYRFERVEIAGGSGPALATGGPAELVFQVGETTASMACGFTIANHLGHRVAGFRSSLGAPPDAVDPALGNAFSCRIDRLPLVPGRYRVDVELWARGVLQDALEGAAVFDVEHGTLAGRPVADDQPGDVAIEHAWALPASHATR
jgi:lipopolysaccharide transport system ATP-binding protein